MIQEVLSRAETSASFWTVPMARAIRVVDDEKPLPSCVVPGAAEECAGAFVQRAWAKANGADLEDRVAKLQRAVYYLIWKRTGFGEQCVHCGHAYPAHAERCKAAEVEGLVR